MELVDIRNNIYYVRENVESMQVIQLNNVNGLDITDIRVEINKKLELFKSKAGIVALKLLLLNNNQEPEFNDLYNKLFMHAYDLGLVKYKEQMSVDFVNHGIFFANLLKIVTFDANKVQNKTNIVKSVEETDVLAENVVELSRYGLQALNYIYMNIGKEKVYLVELIKFMEQMLNTNFNKVMYIGITPSNKLFKFVVSTGHYSNICCSVAFSDWKTFNEKRLSNKLVNGKSISAYKSYCRVAQPNNKFYCIKFSYKDYSNSLYGDGERISRDLRAKYKTLRDVYIGSK